MCLFSAVEHEQAPLHGEGLAPAGAQAQRSDVHHHCAPDPWSTRTCLTLQIVHSHPIPQLSRARPGGGAPATAGDARTGESRFPPAFAGRLGSEYKVADVNVGPVARPLGFRRAWCGLRLGLRGLIGGRLGSSRAGYGTSYSPTSDSMTNVIVLRQIAEPEDISNSHNVLSVMLMPLFPKLLAST